MSSLKRILVIAVLVLLAGFAPGTANEQRVSVTGRASVLVGPTEVCMPPGMWLLVRKERGFCAVRVVEIWTLGDATHAKLEVAVRNASDWKVDVVEASEYPLVGPHAISVQRGNVTISCGSFKVQYSRPSCIGLYAGGGREASDQVQAAPTAWSNRDDLELSEQRLVWYAVDDHRAQEIELAGLAGSGQTN